jgi:hypothetical protein
VSVKTPRFTIQKPQTRHKKPSEKRKFSQNPPEKTQLFVAQQKSYNNTP